LGKEGFNWVIWWKTSQKDYRGVSSKS